METCKFFGKLNYYDFIMYSEEEQKNILIDQNVYIEGKSKEIFKDDVFDPIYMRRSSEKIVYLGKDFSQNGKDYFLNPEFINEIFINTIDTFHVHKKKYIDDNLITLKYSYEIIKIEKQKISFINKLSKAETKKYQENLQKKIFRDLHDSNNDKARGYETLKKHLKNNYEDLADYLFGLNNITNFQIFISLSRFERIKSILDFCESYNDKRANELNKNNEQKKDKLEISKLIFKEDGEEIFNYIVSKYPKEKNTAFFSYLYFFMRDDLKLLIITSDDNKDYRSYVTNKYSISFARIQKSQSVKEFKRNDTIKLFRKYISELTQIRIE